MNSTFSRRISCNSKKKTQRKTMMRWESSAKAISSAPTIMMKRREMLKLVSMKVDNSPSNN